MSLEIKLLDLRGHRSVPGKVIGNDVFPGPLTDAFEAAHLAGV